MIDFEFTFTAPLWVWHGKGAWYFVTLPEDKSEEIKFFHEGYYGKRRGWGAVRVSVSIGSTSWETSIFPYAQANAYILPIKAEVRKKQNLVAERAVTVALAISLA